ncbi:MAG: UDP-4-amino-4,6-dideoxy-N-acetyl-beta-L-altrosamine transaminase [Methylophilus sp.]|uniref:UDP-4-amino-4, 6-dideoxy-N-acetyl-beta-L-altrosamine transaminase n=1 Tax=Methylophilus sp. TaxID=29541 RepID=UPI003F9FADB1
MIPYGRQNISEEDISAVVEVLRSEWLTQGPGIAHFEAAVANHCQAKYAIAVSNATAALHISCLALDVKAGDIVWTSPNTFVASANCARYCEADVDFVDIDPITLNMSVSALQAKLEAAEKTGKLPKVVIPVHFSGLPCDMKAIHALSKKYGFRIIEDASHAIGAQYEGKPVGASEYSDITVFSFHPVKIITTAEGGMALTNQPELADRLARLRSHGIAQRKEHLIKPAEGAWEYQQLELGFNYRMTNLQAALGYSQLQRLTEFVLKRRELARHYHTLIEGLPVTRPAQSENSSWHLYPIRVEKNKRKNMFDAFRQADIWVQVHYIPVHTQPYYQALGFKWGDFPNAEEYFHQAISIPLFFDLSHDDQELIVSFLKNNLY